jgi:hypothetical protein
VLAVPATIRKRQESSGETKVTEVEPEFGGKQSTLLRKLGLDLVERRADKKVVVHVAASRVAPLLRTLATLESAR